MKKPPVNSQLLKVLQEIETIFAVDLEYPSKPAFAGDGVDQDLAIYILNCLANKYPVSQKTESLIKQKLSPSASQFSKYLKPRGKTKKNIKKDADRKIISEPEQQLNQFESIHGAKTGSNQ